MLKINKVLKNTLSAGVLTIFIILGGGSFDTDEGAQKISVTTPDYVLSADTLFKAYDQNSVAADAKYEDKIVKISGTIQSIGKDIFFNNISIMYSLKFFNVTSLLSINKTILCIFMTLDFKKQDRRFVFIILIFRLVTPFFVSSIF